MKAIGKIKLELTNDRGDSFRIRKASELKKFPYEPETCYFVSVYDSCGFLAQLPLSVAMATGVLK
ncbi:hypothetical protein ST37_01790 (plasmid) [Vibrio sp. qd031]|nr:hypothetical protein ST37_01790 [Vibrio sp. qd031]